jgi:tetratricopeptide (TPR) repeat protein
MITRRQLDLNAIEQALPLFGNPLDMQLQQLNLIFHARGYEAALQSFEHLQEQYPNEPELHAMHAAWLFQIGMDEQASEQARNALSSGKGRLSDERHAELDYLMGVQAKNSGQLDQAVHYLSNTIKLAPNHIEALLALGKTYQARRELRQALDVYQRAVDLSKRDYRPYYYAGQVLKDLKNYSESEMMLRQAAKMAPNEVRIHRLLGAVTVLNLVHNRSTATSEIRQ